MCAPAQRRGDVTVKLPAMKSFTLLRRVLIASATSALLLTAACTTPGAPDDDPEGLLFEAADSTAVQEDAAADEQSLQVEGEVPIAVAESEPGEITPPADELEEILIAGRVPLRHDVIRELVTEAQDLLEDAALEYFFTGKGSKETLRGRPVLFALWSQRNSDWTVAHIEIPRPPVNWKPGRKPMKFVMRTPGIQGRHIKGTGAERLMFSFTSEDGEPLQVLGRKFPVFDSALISKKRWRAVAETAQPIIYLPYTPDTFDPLFVSGGRDFLLDTANKALDELRAAQAPSAAYPGKLLADVIPAELVAMLAVIEQTDDTDYTNKGVEAFHEVLNQYGLKREEAYRYSVSSASALGAMQFTNRRGNGTYSLVVRRCPEARLDPVFERGATNLPNAMKAAICLLDIELSQMRADIRAVYRDDPVLLGIFAVAAYNGGPRNVTRLYNVVKKAGVKLADLARPGEQPAVKPVRCPCLWKQTADGVRPVAIPRYNNENRWYIEKYLNTMAVFE